MARRYFYAVAAVFGLISGCSTAPERPTVTLTVSRIPEPPAELVAPLPVPPQGMFVSPSDPRASSALTPEGEAALRKLIGQLLDRLEAWRVWSTTQPQNPPAAE